MAPTMLVDFHSPMTAAIAAMTRSWMTSGLRQRSRTSRKNPILRARVNSSGPYSSMRRAASSDVRPSTVEPSQSSASVVGSWQNLLQKATARVVGYRPSYRECHLRVSPSEAKMQAARKRTRASPGRGRARNSEEAHATIEAVSLDWRRGRG